MGHCGALLDHGWSLLSNILTMVGPLWTIARSWLIIAGQWLNNHCAMVDHTLIMVDYCFAIGQPLLFMMRQTFPTIYGCTCCLLSIVHITTCCQQCHNNAWQQCNNNARPWLNNCLKWLLIFYTLCTHVWYIS